MLELTMYVHRQKGMGQETLQLVTLSTLYVFL